MFALVFFLLGLLGAIVRMQRRRTAWRRDTFAEAWLLHFMFWGLGVGGAFAASGHLFHSDYVAGYVGWPAGNLFQLEVGFANLSFALPGLLAFRYPDRLFRLAVGIVFSTFLAGAGIVHLIDLARTGNVSPGNFGPVLVFDFVSPAVFWILFACATHATARPTSAPHQGAGTRLDPAPS